MKEISSVNKAPRTVLERLRFIGPSAIVTGSVVGSGSIVMTPLLGAAAGFMVGVSYSNVEPKAKRNVSRCQLQNLLNESNEK